MFQLQPQETTSSPPQSVCSSSLDDEQPLQEGVRTQSSQVFSCSECQVFLQHMKSSHNDTYCQMLKRNGQDIPSAACERATKQEDANKPRSCSEPQFPKTSTPPEGKAHQLAYTTGEKIITCKQCDKSFSLLRNFNKHQRVHTGKKPFHCQQCDKSFSRGDHLKRHQSVHTGERPFACKQCDKSFSDVGNLKKHQPIHTGERPFNCQQCDKSFNSLGNLKKHQRLHTGEKPYHCKQCDKRFYVLGHLRRHQRIHTGEKPFHCEQCDKRFNDLSNLKTHQRVHSREKSLSLLTV